MRILAAACLLAVLARPGRAAYLEITTNAGDASAGSVGAALNAAASGDTIFFSPYIPSSVATSATQLFSGAGAGALTLNSDPAAGASVDFTNGLTVSAGQAFSVNGVALSNVSVVGAGGVLSTSYAAVTGLTLNGGTLQARDNSFTSGVTLGAAGGIVDSAGSNPAMADVGGAGALTVVDSVGGGVLSLGGNNTYTGLTTVRSGTLQLASPTAMPSGGNVAVNSGALFDLNGFGQTLGAVTNAGTVRTGAGTLTASSYSGAGAALDVTLQRGGSPNLNITGMAVITNGTLTIQGRPYIGDYTVLTAGTLNGRFSSIYVPAGVTDTFSYVGNSLVLDILTDNPFTMPGQTGNQTAVGTALNPAFFAAPAGSDLAAVLSQLNALAPAQANAALDEISPISLAALSALGFAGSGIQSAAIGQRLSGLQAGAANPDGARFASFNLRGNSSYPGTLVAELPGDASAASMGQKDEVDDSKWGFFASGLGTYASLNTVNGGGGVQPGYSLIATGEALGADYRFSDHLAAGVSGGYVNGFAQLAATGGTLYGQSARLGVYGTAYTEDFHANLYVGGAHDFYDTSRNILMYARTATAEPSGEEFNVDATAGTDSRMKYLTVSPFLGLSYDRLMLNSFTESGAGALDLGVAPQLAQSLRSSLGSKFSYSFNKTGWFVVTPYGSAGWRHEFVNQSRPIEASLASGGSGAFSVRTADVARDALLFGGGLDLDWGKGCTTRLAYSADRSADFHANTFSGSLRLKW